MKLGLRPTLSLISALLATLLLAACGAPPRHFAPAAESGRGYYKVGAPYQIDGVWYYPKEDLSYDETGIASWYGEQFHGRYTANGEIFDLNALTAAHRTLPMPSVVRVTNLENGRAIKLRVNDRGPYARGRILDVSRRGAQLLGFEGNGTAKVRVQIMVEDSIQVAAIAKRGGAPEAPSAIAEAAASPAPPIPAAASPPSAEPAPVAAPREIVSAQPLPPPPGTRTAENKPILPPPGPVNSPAGSEVPTEAPPLPETVTTVPVKPTQIYVQAGAFTQHDNAMRMESRLAGMGSPVKITGIRVNGASIFRVRLGPIASVDEADRLLDRVVAGGIPEARIVVD